MSIIVRVTTYFIDDTHSTKWVNFGMDLVAAMNYYHREKARKINIFTKRRDVQIFVKESQ